VAAPSPALRTLGDWEFEGRPPHRTLQQWAERANLLFTWRRQLGVERVATKELAPILPVIGPESKAGLVITERVARWRLSFLRASG
jgi:hypothetical protein